MIMYTDSVYSDSAHVSTIHWVDHLQCTLYIYTAALSCLSGSRGHCGYRYQAKTSFAKHQPLPATTTTVQVSAQLPVITNCKQEEVKTSKTEMSTTTTTTTTILSIDIGTSSVKCSVVEIKRQKPPSRFSSEDYRILSSGKCQYDAVRIRRSPNPSYSQQSVEEIFKCISLALDQAGVSTDRSFDLVSVCGQMHGVVLWNDETLFGDDDGGQRQLNFSSISDHYDWTDGRCTEDFLASLPPPECHTDVMSTGYGTASIFWLLKNEPQYLRQFNRAATIMDFFSVVLCKLVEPSISLQNANNWGYFNTEEQAWNVELLNANGFPVNLLPTVVPLNTVVGQTKNFAPIADGIPVMVSFGDLQAVLTLAFLNNEDALVLNMGTSIQLVRFESAGFKPPKKSTSLKPSVDYMPYDASRYLAVAAGLNGGNVLRSYAAYLQDIVRQLTGIEMTEAEVWKKLASICEKEEEAEEGGESASSSSSLHIQPRLFGERHQPESDFQLKGVRFELPRLASLTRALCASLLNNIFDMMALSEEECAQTRTIVCTGNVMARNEVLQAEFKKIIDERFTDSNLPALKGEEQGLRAVEVHFLDECDADVGCALLAYRQYTR